MTTPSSSSPVQADRARAAGEEVPADVTRDSDGTPVGEADAEADARRTGGEVA